MTEDEQQIAGLQETLDVIADKIDEQFAEFEDVENEAELNSKLALALRVLHARYSVALHLLRTGREPKPIKPLE